MFTGNLMNLCNRKRNLEVFENKLSNSFIVAAFLSCILLAICIFFELSNIPLFIFFGIVAILLITSLIVSYIKDKTKNKIMKIVKEELSKVMRSIFSSIPNDERVFSVYCWKYDRSEFVFHIEVYSDQFTHDQIAQKIRPIQNDINYVSDIQLNIYYCIWPTC